MMFSGINSQFGNSNRLLEKENSGQLSSLSLKNTTTNNGSAPLQPSALRQKLYGSSGPLGERKALGEITNTSKSNSITNKKLLTTTSTGETKLLFVPTSLNPQIRKKTKTTIKPIINQSVVSKVKKVIPPPPSPQQPLHDNNTVYSAPPAPLRLSSKLTNETIESLIMTPSYDIPISGYTESFEENIFKFDQSQYQPTDDHSLMIEDNFSFSDYYQDIVL